MVKATKIKRTIKIELCSMSEHDAQTEEFLVSQIKKWMKIKNDYDTGILNCVSIKFDLDSF